MISLQVAMRFKNYSEFIGAPGGAYSTAALLSLTKLEQAITTRKALEQEIAEITAKNPRAAKLIREVSSC